MSAIQTLEQRRACDAWDAVQRVKSAKDAESYQREAKRLPVRIATAGLGHAIAFANARKGTNKRVADDVANWVLTILKAGPRTMKDDRSLENTAVSLMKQIVENDADWLRRSTEEALAYLRWLSRFAEAEIASEDKQEKSEP